MTSVETVAPIRKHIVIEAAQAHVFSVFTDGIHKWWPPEHHIGSSPLKRAVLEPKRDGRWYSICQDDSECEIGKVLVWDPPKRLVLSWQLNAEFKYDPKFITEVELNFTAEGPKKTRVDLEHRNLSRYGVAAEKISAMLSAPGGWPATLTSFAAVASK